jgi:hypothetical protein
MDDWLTICELLLLLYVFLDASTNNIGEEELVGDDLAEDELEEELFFLDRGRYL